MQATDLPPYVLYYPANKGILLVQMYSPSGIVSKYNKW